LVIEGWPASADEVKADMPLRALEGTNENRVNSDSQMRRGETRENCAFRRLQLRSET
jgi:hypothetical protein